MNTTSKKALLISSSFLFLFLATLETAQCFSLGFFMGQDTFHLVIINDLNRALKVKCARNGKDLGERDIHPKGDTSWDVEDEIFDQTQVNCDFNSGSLSGNFDIFIEGQTGYFCTDTCKYTAKDDGLWFFDSMDTKWKLLGKWKSQ